ncbi:hypothetical protein MFUR16E_04785 [Methylobacterium fujisawaense]|uniref:glycine-rich domain-containing protein n=1 Tax=Methylobacterium fujisawaense TaxID=107400 RepID=UPI002F2EA131
MDYVPPTGSSTATAPYVGKNTAAGTQGSKVPPGAVEYPQREIVAAIAASGAARSNADLTQLTGAIGRGIWLGALALTLGAPNALAGSIGGGGAIIQSLPAWTKLRGTISQTNTTATVNVTVTGVGSANGTATGPLLRRDGKPLAVGDLTVGVIEFQPDGAGNFRLVGVAASETPAQSSIGKGLKEFATAGSGTWTVPDGVYWVYATAIGGGAGGSGATTSGPTTTSGGGGAGETRFGWIPVTPGQVIPYVVGAGGLGVAYGQNSGNGGATSIGSLITAMGGNGTGNGGVAGGGGGIGGTGGQGSSPGGNGLDGNLFTASAPGGGGGGSSRGGGGRASTIPSGTVTNGKAPGSGGGGVYSAQNTGLGGTGADGLVSFQF